MAELADAHGSGPCESNFMQVQVLSSAPNKNLKVDINLEVLLFYGSIINVGV